MFTSGGLRHFTASGDDRIVPYCGCSLLPLVVQSGVTGLSEDRQSVTEFKCKSMREQRKEKTRGGGGRGDEGEEKKDEVQTGV